MKSKLKLFSLLGLAALLFAPAALAQRQAENLGRGLVAMKKNSTQIYVSWRLLATDPTDVSFKLYRVASGVTNTLNSGNAIANTTDYLDTPTVSVANTYFVRPVTNGVEGAASASFTVAASAPTRQYIPVPLHAVDGGEFPPYDVKYCWVGDLNGDGEYDFVVDRLSTVAATNQYLQAYLRDGTFLWQMDMGHNSVDQYAHEPGSSAISIGMGDCVTVYDMDGDGKAEVLVRTANGVTVTNAAGIQVANITAANDLIQYMTVLDGMTGAVRDSKVIPNPYSAQGPIYGHMGIMYADGVRPSVLYEGWNRNDSAGGDEHFNVTLTTWDFRNGALTQLWWWERGYNPMGEGHQIRIADVDHDGKDEFCEIGFVVDDNGTTLFNTELAHGDRFHIMDIDPDRAGLETYAIQQYNTTLLATGFYESATGKFLKKWYAPGIVDVGRGIALDMDAVYRGCEMYSTQPGIFDRKGAQIFANNMWAPEAIWWDADLSRELEDGAGSGAYSPVINKFNHNTGGTDRLYSIYNEGVHQQYGGRAAFWGDILGDWREEVVLVADDYSEFRIYTTTISATNRLYCLMQNPAYRMQATCKGYYQANYVDYYLGTEMTPPAPAPISDAALVWRGGGANDWDSGVTANWYTNNLWLSNTTAVPFPAGTTVLFDLTGSNNVPINLTGTLTPASVMVHSPKAYTFGGSGALAGTMKLTKAGAGKLTFTGTNTYTGATLIAEGPFVVDGSLPNSPVTVRGGVWLDGRLGGTGAVGGVVSIQEGAGLSPGAGTNSPGTLTISNHLTLAGRTLNNFDLSDDPAGTTKTNDLVVVTGNLTLQGTNALVIQKLNATLPPGVYPLINYAGTLSGSLNNLSVAGLDGVPLALTNPPGQIALVIIGTRAPATLNWTGGLNGNAWDLLTTSNWLNGATKAQFVPGDTVRFDSIGTSNLTANLAGSLNVSNVIVDSTANYTLAGSGAIIGSASLLKSNTGTLTITANNSTFTGRTVIAGGTVIVSELDAAGFPSSLGNVNSSPTNLLLTGNATLRVTSESYTDRGLTLGSGSTNSVDVFNSADQLTMAGLITGSGAFQKLGAGVFAITRSNNYSGATLIKAGSVSLGGDAANVNGFGTSGGTVILDGGGFTMYNNIDGSSDATSTWNLIVPAAATGFINADGRGKIAGTLSGGGTLTFWTPYVRTDINGNWSAFTGQINLTTDGDGGHFRINNSAGYPNAAMNLAAGVNLYSILSGTPTIDLGSLSGASGTYIIPSAKATGDTPTSFTLRVGGRNTDTTFAGNIGAGATVSLIKQGTGTWTLSGTNTYTGTTTINAGGLLVNGNNAPALGGVTVATSGTLGGVGTIGGSVTITGKLAPGNNAIGTLTCTNNVTFNASGTAVIEINKTSGTRDLLDVGNTLTYGGTLQVTNLSGTLASGNSYKIFDAATYAGSFTTYNLPGLAAGLAWDTSALPSSGTISVTTTNATGPKALVWKGDGALNSWDINVTANWLDTNSAAAYFTNFDSVTFNDVGSNNSPVFLTGSLQPSALVVNATKDYTFGGAGSIAGTNSLVKTGSGTLSLATSNSYSGATLISNGTLRLTSISLGLAHRWSFNGNLTDSVGGQNATVVDVGANNTTLSATEITLAGGAQGSSDYVDLGDQVLPNGTTPVTIELWAKPISVQNWSRIFDFGATTAENLMMSWTRGTTLAQDRVEWVDTAGATTSDDTCQPYTLGVEFHIAMVIEPGAGAGGTTRVTWYRAAATDSVIGAARGTFNTTNTLAIMNDTNCWLGRSQWPDNTANASYNEMRTWNRALSAVELQTLHTAGADAVLGTVGLAGTGSLPGTTAVNLAGTSAKLENLSGQSQTIASLTGVAGSEVKLTSGSVITGGDNSSTSFAGFFSGPNNFTKTGSGTLTLAGNSTHTGATTVSAGTVLVHGNNSAASGAVSVASGATLGGNGSLGGATTILAGGKLAPGASIGAITFTNSLTLSGTTLMEISHTPLTNDVVNKTGALTYNGALQVTNISGTLAAGDSFKLFNAASYAGSFSSITLPSLNAGLIWTTNTLNTTGTISVSSAVSTTPTNLTFTVSGNSLTLSWPASHTGWTLQAQTNSLNAGLSATWYPIAGSAATNQMTLPVNPANPTVFYRLTYP